MNVKKLLLFLCTFVFVLLITAPAPADWIPGDPFKWLQSPDLMSYGIDIRMDNRGGKRAIGDDFQCTETGLITDVHLWVSWKDDITGPISGIKLSIYDNNPSGPGGFSQPNALKWEKYFPQDEFIIRLYESLTDYEGWWDPRAGGYIPNGDHNIYQINFDIDPAAAFYQEGSPDNPVIYWLVVEPNLPTPGTTALGWKTRSYFEAHFMDDAVWRSTPTSPWVELRYPQGHPLIGNSIDMAFVITTQTSELEFGDAPEGAVAYPIECVQGAFPTCIGTGPAGWIQHTNGGSYFGPMVDFENEGNAGNCPLFTPNTYNQDECYQDGDGGLLYPPAYTITGPVGSETVVPCNAGQTGSLGTVCDTAVWGQNIDIEVSNISFNFVPVYVNVLADWNKDGQWAGSLSGCSSGAAPEHILVNFPVGYGFQGNLSDLFPPNFLIGPYPGYVWFRFSITDEPVTEPWDGSGSFWNGETEDYLLHIDPIDKPYDCNWSEGDDHKMHYPQLPDLNPTGLDVDMFWTPLGDDFLCTQTGWITDIHFWASYPDDCLPPQGVAGLTFKLDIYSNLPADGQIPWSRPGEVLWSRTFEPCTYTVKQVADDKIEGWYDPATQLFIPADHNQCYQYNFCIGMDENPFLQTAGTTYWLVIKDIPPDPANYTIGWKTTYLPLQWNDDAVWLNPTMGWAPLTYPPGHPYEGMSFDLAFVITGKEKPPKPKAEHLKWAQPPVEKDPCMIEPEYCGWNEESWEQEPIGIFPNHSVADDYRCIGDMPVTSIHWWGSFLNWTTIVPPPIMPSHWNIKFYANVPGIPGGDPNYSHPGRILWDVNIPNWRVYTDYNGSDYHPQYGTESCFQHYVQLEPDEFFKQGQYLEDTNDNIFWLGITAIYPQGMEVLNPWGWKTRPESWMDDAVKWECRLVGWEIDPGSGELIPVFLCTFWPMVDPVTLESVDVAFELDTDPNWIKWEQAYCGIRQWPHYNDERSIAKEEPNGTLKITRQAADDWLCKRRTPVTSLVWWGSYLDYNYMPCTSIPAPNPPVKPDYFLINIWTDVPAIPGAPNYSHPGVVLWEYRAYDYDEVLVGYDKQPELQQGPPREPVFRYSVRLPEEKWFKQRKINQIYWVSIMAVYKFNNPPNYQWGWTNHKHFFQDDAVAGRWEGTTWVWDKIFDQTGASADLSFVLFTDPNECVSCADYNWSGLVEFKDYAIFALDWLLNVPAGGYANGDLNCDGDVNYEDLKIFCQQWLQTCP